MKTSIDKCSGPECPCHLAKKTSQWDRILSKFGPDDEVEVGIAIGRPPAAGGQAVRLNGVPFAGETKIQFMDTTPRPPAGPQMDALIMTVEAYRRLKERR